MPRVALVTGANRGIGLEIARQLAARGDTVLLGSRDPERGDAAARRLARDGLDARPLPLDVADGASVAALRRSWPRTRVGSTSSSTTRESSTTPGRAGSRRTSTRSGKRSR